MAKSRKASRRTRKVKRGGVWYDPRTWFGQQQEQVTPVSQTPMSDVDGVSLPTTESSSIQGGKHHGRRHRKTKRRSH